MKILYACNDLDYFRAHRWFLAEAMHDEGHDVLLSTGGVQISNRKTDKNIKILDVNVDRHKFNLKSDLALLRSFVAQLKTEKPDVVHAITIKPILFMSLAALINKTMRQKTPKLVLTYPGLGKIFEPDNRLKGRVQRFLVSKVLGLCDKLLKPSTTFENFSSMEELIKEGITNKSRSSVVMGAGIDRDIFYPAQNKGALVVLFASRLLNAKGLGEYIEAARDLKAEFPKVIFQVAGKKEESNPDAFSMDTLKASHDAGVIDYLGEINPEQMPDLLRASDIHVAPSKLQEGLPRVVLEAASCGCCVITSDHEMLRRFVVDGKTGWLIKTVSSEAIKDKLRLALANSSETRKRGELAAKTVMALPIFEDNLITHFKALYEF